MKLLSIILLILCCAVWSEDLALARKLAAEEAELPRLLTGTPAEFMLSSWPMALARRELKKGGPVEKLDVRLLAEVYRDCQRGLAWQEKNVEVTIPRLPQPPRLDGRVEPGEWDKALIFHGEYRISETEKIPDRKSSVWYVGYHGNVIYAAASFREDSPEIYTDKYDGDRKRLMFMGDAFEFFIKPELPYGLYLECVVNPAGKLWNLLHVRTGDGRQFRFHDDFQADIRAAGSCEDNRFTVELMIPVSAIFGKWAGVEISGNEKFSFIMARANRKGDEYFMSSPVKLLYDSHNVFGYVRAVFEK